MATEKIKEATEDINVAEQRFMCQFDTIEQLYFEKEKLYLSKMDDMEKRHAEERESMRKQNIEEKESMRKHYQRIIFSISLVLLLIVGSLVGGLIYLFSNYDIGYEVYQEVSAEGGGDSTIEDGIRLGNIPASDYNAK